jgi:hypothetical protein
MTDENSPYYYNKYLKYKMKYIELQNQIGGVANILKVVGKKMVKNVNLKKVLDSGKKALTSGEFTNPVALIKKNFSGIISAIPADNKLTKDLHKALVDGNIKQIPAEFTKFIENIEKCFKKIKFKPIKPLGKSKKGTNFLVNKLLKTIFAGIIKNYKDKEFVKDLLEAVTSGNIDEIRNQLGNITNQLKNCNGKTSDEEENSGDDKKKDSGDDDEEQKQKEEENDGDDKKDDKKDDSGDDEEEQKKKEEENSGDDKKDDSGDDEEEQKKKEEEQKKEKQKKKEEEQEKEKQEKGGKKSPKSSTSSKSSKDKKKH